MYYERTSVPNKTTTNRRRERIEGMRRIEFVPFFHSLSLYEEFRQLRAELDEKNLLIQRMEQTLS